MLASNLAALSVPAGAVLAQPGLEALREAPEAYWDARSQLPWT
jgi:hypothetical protein